MKKTIRFILIFALFTQAFLVPSHPVFASDPVPNSTITLTMQGPGRWSDEGRITTRAGIYEPTSGTNAYWWTNSYNDSVWRTASKYTGWSNSAFSGIAIAGLPQVFYSYSDNVVCDGGDYMEGFNRQTFSYPGLGTPVSATLEWATDDGGSFYLNGHRIATNSTPAKTVVNFNATQLSYFIPNNTNLVANNAENVCDIGGMQYRLTIVYDGYPPTVGFTSSLYGFDQGLSPRDPATAYWKNQNTIFTPSCSDIYGISEVYISSYNGGWSSSQFTPVQGVNEIWIGCKDTHGNWNSGFMGIYKLDTTPPTNHNTNVSGSVWYNAPILPTVSSTAQDSVSGISQTFVADYNGTYNWQSNITTAVNGIHTISCKAVDYAGNESIKTDCGTLKIDVDPPQPAFRIENENNWGVDHQYWYNYDLSIVPDSYDAVSGIYSQSVSDTNGNWRSRFTATASSNIFCTATDNANNSASGLCGAVKIDKAEPTYYLEVTYSNPDGQGTTTITNPPSSAIYSRDVSVHMVASDGQSGLASSCITTNSDYSNCTSTTIAVTNSASLYCKIADVAGNNTRTPCMTIQIDRNAPLLGFSGAISDHWYGILDVPLNLYSHSIAQNTTGLPEQYISLTSNWGEVSQERFTDTTPLVLQNEGVRPVYCYAKDGAVPPHEINGQCATIKIDKTPPTSLVSINPSTGWARQKEVTITGSDTLSLIAHNYCKLSTDENWTDSGTQPCRITVSTHNTVVKYYSKDVAGNANQEQSLLIDQVDDIPPTDGQNLTFSEVVDKLVPSNPYPITVTISAGTDAGPFQSGVAGIACGNSSAPPDISLGSCTAKFNTPEDVVYYRTKDNVGNWSSANGVMVTADQIQLPTPPAETIRNENQTDYSATNGVLMSRKINNETASYAYTDGLRPFGVTSVTKQSDSSPSTRLGYDANGNVVSYTKYGIEYELAYDVDNHLSSIQSKNEVSTSAAYIDNKYVYDYTGQRIVSYESKPSDAAQTVVVDVSSTFEVTLSDKNCSVTSPDAPALIDHPNIDGDNDFTFSKQAPTSPCVSWKVYYANTERVQKNGAADEVYTHLKDNIVSTSRVVKNSDMSAIAMRYGVWGEARSAAVNSTSTTDLLYTGQEKTSNLGFYYYDARWYDPAIGRFLQPDNMIPNIYAPQNLDRYSYVLNNPINFYDPTGHKECDPDDDIDACSYNSSLNVFINMLYVRYGIKLGRTSVVDQNLALPASKDIRDDIRNTAIDADDARALYKAAYYMNKSMNGKFKDVIGETSVDFRHTNQYMGGQWLNNHIIFLYMYFTNTVPLQLIYHEFGHLVDYEIFGGGPHDMLANNSFTTSDGTFVMGKQGNNYNRQGGEGYFHPCAPNQDYCLSELHPRSLDSEGNTGYEEWADMFSNYVNGSFAQNPIGDVRKQFVERWMASYPFGSR